MGTSKLLQPIQAYRLKEKILLVLILLLPGFSFGQIKSELSLVIKSDSLKFSDSLNTVRDGDSTYLYFKTNEEQPVVQLFFKKMSVLQTGLPSLLVSDHYIIIDSLKKGTDGSFVGRIRLNDVLIDPRPVLSVRLGAVKFQINLLPIVHAVIALDSKPVNVFQEEQKTIEFAETNGYNIKSENSFITGKDFDYKLTNYLNLLAITIRPHTIGFRNINIPLQSNLPVLDQNRKLTNNLQILSINLNVKAFKLSYINFDKGTIFSSLDSKSSQQLLVDYNPLFEQTKVFRIEDQQSSGGELIAELTVESILDNTKKIVCRIRPVSYHKVSDGYLYIKDGEKNRFICNLNIVEKPKIDKVSIRKSGGDWDEGLTVHPGEQVEVRIQGNGLETNKIQFDGITDAKLDSLKSSDEYVYFHFKVPVAISGKHITVFLDRKETAYQISVKDYLKPAPFDFVSINYGEKSIPLTDFRFNKPMFYDSAVKDINITFNPNRIDVGDKLYGKQYISIEVKILNKDNDLIEDEKIENLVICPGDQSPRKGHYDNLDCNAPLINLNDYLDHKTYKLPEFTQIIIIVSHDDAKYEENKGNKKKIKLILSRKYNFDLQLSFPTGLLVQNLGEGGGIASLSGISAAVLFNMTPYDDKQPGQLRPYSIGAGFLALNALNLSSSASSDLGIVVLGTVQPFRKNAKFSVPIYFGCGYFVKSEKFFEILGPGLQFNF